MTARQIANSMKRLDAARDRRDRAGVAMTAAHETYKANPTDENYGRYCSALQAYRAANAAFDAEVSK